MKSLNRYHQTHARFYRFMKVDKVITIAELCQTLAISQSMVTYWLSGRNKIPIIYHDALDKLMDEFNPQTKSQRL